MNYLIENAESILSILGTVCIVSGALAFIALITTTLLWITQPIQYITSQTSPKSTPAPLASKPKPAAEKYTVIRTVDPVLIQRVNSIISNNYIQTVDWQGTNHSNGISIRKDNHP